MSVKRYRVTCLGCKQSDILMIDDDNHVVLDSEAKLLTNFKSYRWRPDMQWGFECRCDNDNRLAPQEKGDMDKLVQGDPVSVQRIADSLKIPDEKQFEMSKA